MIDFKKFYAGEKILFTFFKNEKKYFDSKKLFYLIKQINKQKNN